MGKPVIVRDGVTSIGQKALSEKKPDGKFPFVVTPRTPISLKAYEFARSQIRENGYEVVRGQILRGEYSPVVLMGG